MDFRENLTIIATKEELQKLIDKGVSKAITDLNLSHSLQKEESKLIYGLDGLAKFLGCSEMTAFRLKKSGRIPYFQTGRTLVFKSDEVLKAMEKKKR
ncbi:MAG: DUF3853 family protein [Mangrovibacterium sp.]